VRDADGAYPHFRSVAAARPTVSCSNPATPNGLFEHDWNKIGGAPVFRWASSRLLATAGSSRFQFGADRVGHELADGAGCYGWLREDGSPAFGWQCQGRRLTHPAYEETGRVLGRSVDVAIRASNSLSPA
jgi:hypothetical protein